MIAHLFDDFIIISRIGDDGHGRMVLGRRPQHRRASDINVFDGMIQTDVGFGDGLFKRV